MSGRRGKRFTVVQGIFQILCEFVKEKNDQMVTRDNAAPARPRKSSAREFF
jgi:hypothetical protein